MTDGSDAAVTVRAATREDAAALAEFGRRTFAETYAAANHPAEVEAHLARTFGEEQQLAEIADPLTHVIVVEVERALGGYAVLHDGLAAPAGDALVRPAELARFYVDQQWHGRGLADALIEGVLETAGTLGVESLWLLVWEQNARAIGFYRRHGFREKGAAVFLFGNEPQQDKLLVRIVRERRATTPPSATRVVRPALTVRLQRGRDARDLFACVRSDGTTSWLRRPGGLPRRDRAILAVEGVLGVSDGVLGTVADGGELLELLRPESTSGHDAVGWSLRFAALLDAERAAPKPASVERILEKLHDDGIGATAPVVLDAVMMAEVRAALDGIEATWRTLGAGEALEFTMTPGVARGLGAPRVMR